MGPCPAPGRSHRDVLLTLIRNLINNAIKFTPPGEAVTIHQEIEEGMVRVSVTDTGTGISAGGSFHTHPLLDLPNGIHGSIDDKQVDDPGRKRASRINIPFECYKCPV